MAAAAEVSAAAQGASGVASAPVVQTQSVTQQEETFCPAGIWCTAGRAIECNVGTYNPTVNADDATAWSNALMPDLQGKVIRTKIVAVDARNGVATAVTGVRGPTTFKMSEFDRPVGVGDVVEARVTWMNNPTGHLDLECRSLDARRGRERVWRELTRARDGGKTIRGRILNAVNGGYAVGIAGLIAFLPARAYRGRAPPTSVERAIAAEGSLDGDGQDNATFGLLAFAIALALYGAATGSGLLPDFLTAFTTGDAGS